MSKYRLLDTVWSIPLSVKKKKKHRSSRGQMDHCVHEYFGARSACIWARARAFWRSTHIWPRGRAFGHASGHFGARHAWGACARAFRHSGTHLRTWAGILEPGRTFGRARAFWHSGAHLGTCAWAFWRSARVWASARAFRRSGARLRTRTSILARGRAFWCSDAC